MDKDSIIDAAARFAQNAQEQPMQPQVIQPHPVPMSVQLAHAIGPDGKKLVVFILHHGTGSSVFHFDPDGADQIADSLKDAARSARSGLEVPKIY